VTEDGTVHEPGSVIKRVPAEPDAVIRASSKVTTTSVGPPLKEI